MPEWLIERGIGETRAVLIGQDEIIETRVFLDEAVPAGSVLEARLKRAGIPAVAVAGGQEYLLPKGAPGIVEGGTFTMEITRESIPGAESWKHPLAAACDAEPHRSKLPGRLVTFPNPIDEFGMAGWHDVLEEARSGVIRFGGGDLRVSPTPAMTLIDVDGTLPPYELALAGVRAAARTIRRHGIGGSIGVDLPTLRGKEQRKAAVDAFDLVFPQPFERTAVNGFGFLQIVRPRRHASLFELAQDRTAFEARALLRAAAMSGPGIKRLVAHPAVVRLLEGWTEGLLKLATQVGGRVDLRADAALPMSGGYAEPA